MPDTPNIIFLTIDALRADHCSGWGYERETTPNLDGFADSAIEFRECISVSSHTREAMPPLLSGYRPSHFAANGFQATDRSLLAERLSDQGYQTGGFHSNPYLSRAYGYGRGFDEFYDDLLLGRNRLFALAQRALEKFVFKRGEYYARADEINRRSLEWIDSRDEDRPLFLWNHYMDAHGPYHAPERHWAEKSLSASDAESLYRRSWKDPDSISDDERRLLEDSYDDEIRWLDEQIGTFFEELRSRNLLKESLVVITSDHGDAFGEHGYYTHPRYLHDILLHVPLLVSVPGEREATIGRQVSTLDIVPTILQSAGLSSTLPGSALVDREGSLTDGPETVFASATGENDDEGLRRFAGRRKDGKVIIDVDIDDGRTIDSQAFDLEADQEEQHPVPADEFRSLLEEVESYTDGRLDVRSEEAPESVDADIDDRLEALGYK